MASEETDNLFYKFYNNQYSCRPEAFVKKTAIILGIIAILADCSVEGSSKGALSLETIMTGGNSMYGVMFEIIAIHDVKLHRIRTHQDAVLPATHPIEIYYRYGGISTTANGWILAGSASVDFAPSGTLTEIPINLNLPMQTGEVYGIYVTTTNNQRLAYTTSAGAGVFYANDDLSIKADGYGLVYPFGTTYTPRTFNGTVTYDLH